MTTLEEMIAVLEDRIPYADPEVDVIIAKLRRLDKLEAVASKANAVRTSVDSADRRACEWGLWSALAALDREDV